ncbi:Lytic transglycosylase catalytic [Desulfarculus baarsii DSM 2075]|uniref:Lytic transglycosylase catalytic n=1 Tax=Desulfarculus baarsii (strain ATCC 33931 / DSM 2075 / LMG 7858 / VKM B-1802 / 2st14) TaxID=644282 RepID=E1QGU3_DESB2|nr:lytic transglycosylase domain-containing protein [Desulfarculus baarsii]ADK84786.1 Lytic transglycosylase catalytic [Desulfarculus baarsii DSM 2075]
MAIAPTSGVSTNRPISGATASGQGHDLAALIRAASQRGDEKLLAKLAELMINQSAIRIGGGGAPSAAAQAPPAGQTAGARAKLYGLAPDTAVEVSSPAQAAPQVNAEPAAEDENLTPAAPQPGLAQRAYRQKLDDIVVRAARRHGVDPHLARAVVTAESDFNPASTSPAGAMGLMQLMPETARDLGVSDPYDPEQNVDGGVRYLGQMLSRFDGSVDKALMAYNWGPSNVERQGRPPAETRAYLQKVMRLRQLYAEGFSARA